MLDDIAPTCIRSLGQLLLWLIFWPVALVVGTPGVFLFATVAVARGQRRFFDALSYGYWSISAFYRKWVF